MKILIDIGHPAHVHLYRNFYFETLKRGHHIVVTTKDLESAKQLLDLFNIPYIVFSKKSDNLTGKIFRQLKFDWEQYKIVRKHRIDIGVGTSITNSHISRITRMKSIIMDDDDDAVQSLFVKFAHPFADCILSPDVLKGKRRRRDTIYYSGYHELAYLHPNRFEPDHNIISELKLKPEEQFFIMRFNAFKAHHDIGRLGLSLNQKLQLIKLLGPKGRVFITTEREIEPELSEYLIKISPEKIHSLLYYATLFIGDSQTMASEAAILGTPAIRCNTFVGQISYLEEEEHKYGLTYGFRPDSFSSLLKKVQELLEQGDLKVEWQSRRQKMLSDKIDVTSFMIWFIENYPESKRIMKNNPNYQYNFR
ncbi:MAG: DUF354 domain-containing protein [Deltaproteobacteria bacterium]|nr:DUF354 domain-containing protein [Deltaproteobacteria bacterium]